MAMIDKAPRSATATALRAGRALAIQRGRFFELLRSEPLMATKLTWSFIQVINARLRATNRELLAARETIEALRRNPGGAAELPVLDPSVGLVAALPFSMTDELIPGFLLSEQESGGTDPLLRVGTEETREHGDLDERRGLMAEGQRTPVPATVPERPSMLASPGLMGTHPNLTALDPVLPHDEENS